MATALSSRRLPANPVRRVVAAVVAVLACATVSAAVLVALTTWPARAQGTERISDYEVRVDVHSDGTLRVTEVIGYDFGTDRRHGIVRVIPVRLPYDRGHYRTYPVSDVTVTATGGASASVRTSRDGGDERIRVGDPASTVTGKHTYTIGYTVQGAVSAVPAGGAELSWNAIGTEWSVPITRAAVTVTGPAEVRTESCVAGASGAHTRCGSVAREGRTASFTQADLAADHGVTVRVTFPAGSVHGLGPLLASRHTVAGAFEVTRTTAAGAVAVALAGVLGALLMAWYASGAAATRRRAPERFVDLSARLSPAEAGALWAGRLRGTQLAATIADLGARGYLRITEVGSTRGRRRRRRRDWQVARIGDPAPDLRRHERALLDALFHGDRTVRLSTLDRVVGERIRPYWAGLRDDVGSRVWHKYRIEVAHRRSSRAGIALVAASVSVTVLLALFTRTALVGGGLVGGSVAFAAVLRRWPLPTGQGGATRGQLARLRRHLLAAGRSAGRSADPGDVVHYFPYAVALDAVPRRARRPDLVEGFELPWYSGEGVGATTPMDARRCLAAFTALTTGVRSSPALASDAVHHASAMSWGSYSGGTGGLGGGFGGDVGSGGGGGGGGSW